jgi:hypothetical protein
MNWSLIPNNCEPKPVFICLLQRVANITAIILFHPSNSPQLCMNNGIDGYAELLPSGSYTAHNNWDLLLLRTIAETINARTVPMSYFARFVVPINCHRISSSFFLHSSSSSCSRATFFIPRIIDWRFSRQSIHFISSHFKLQIFFRFREIFVTEHGNSDIFDNKNLTVVTMLSRCASNRKRRN